MIKAWDLIEPRKLFTARDDDGDLYDAAHLAQLIAALGPPPPDYLAKNSERRAEFWDEQGMSIIRTKYTRGRIDWNIVIAVRLFTDQICRKLAGPRAHSTWQDNGSTGNSTGK